MNNIYHGILLDLEFSEPKFIENNFTVFAKRKSVKNPWVLFGVKIEIQDIGSVISKIQESLKSNEPYYVHLYNDNEVIVIFKNKVFYVTPHVFSWNEIVEYGKSLNIPESQLDFWPNRFQDEIHYFKKEDFV